MTIINYLFLVLVLFMLNEYRLIRKQLRIINEHPSKPNGLILSIEKTIFKTKNWVDNKLLNNDLNY